MSLKPFLAAPVILATLLACGGGGGTSTSYGTLSLKLGSDSTSNFSQAWVSVESVQVKRSDQSSWSTLATVQKSWDLLALQNGNGDNAVLASKVSLPTGTYSVRLFWASTNYAHNISAGALLLPGETDLLNSHPMTLPSTTTTSGTLTISKDALTSGEIFIQGNQLAQYFSSLTVPYTFHATATVLDLSGCGKITGSTGLSGAEVFAQTVDGNGLASVQRRALTDSNGNFVMDGLPIGSVYYLASQPGSSSSAYAAVSASPVTVASATTYTSSLSFASGTTPASLTVNTTTASTTSQGTWVELRQSVLAGSNNQSLVVRAQTVNTNTNADTTTFSGLVSGHQYGVEVQRSTSGGSSTASSGGQQTVSGTTTISVTTN